MTIDQTLIILLIGILIAIGYFTTGYNIDYKKSKNGVLGLVLLTFLAYFSLAFLAIQTIQNNELNTKLKNKCPEYEKIENVYRLKE